MAAPSSSQYSVNADYSSNSRTETAPIFSVGVPFGVGAQFTDPSSGSKSGIIGSSLVTINTLTAMSPVLSGSYSNPIGGGTVSINDGGGTYVVTSGGPVTPAEDVAVIQVLSLGSQTIGLLGNPATGPAQTAAASQSTRQTCRPLAGSSEAPSCLSII